MNHLRKFLKRANVSPEQLADAMKMTYRSISYHYTTGRMPYAIIYKMSIVTGVPIAEIVPKHIAEEWLYLLETQLSVNKPRGKQKNWQPGDNEKWAEELDEPQQEEPQKKVATIPKIKKAVKKATPPTVPREKVTPPPVKYPVIEEPVPIKRTRSIADIMKSTPAAPQSTGPEPDFSKISDELFQTSMDKPARRR